MSDEVRPLSEQPEKLEALDNLLEKMGEWKTARTTEIFNQVAFLKSLDVSIEGLVEPAANEALELAIASVEDITGYDIKSPAEEEGDSESDSSVGTADIVV